MAETTTKAASTETAFGDLGPSPYLSGMDSLLYAELDPAEAERLTRDALAGLEDGELRRP